MKNNEDYTSINVKYFIYIFLINFLIKIKQGEMYEKDRITSNGFILKRWNNTRTKNINQ